MTLNQAIDRLHDLNPGVVAIDSERHERPYEPLLASPAPGNESQTTIEAA